VIRRYFSSAKISQFTRNSSRCFHPSRLLEFRRVLAENRHDDCLGRFDSGPGFALGNVVQNAVVAHLTGLSEGLERFREGLRENAPPDEITMNGDFNSIMRLQKDALQGEKGGNSVVLLSHFYLKGLMNTKKE